MSIRYTLITMSSSFTVFTCIIGFLLVIRWKKFPLAAHGRWYLLLKVVATLCIFLRYVIHFGIIVEFDNILVASIGHAFYGSVVPALYEIPFFIRYWRISFVFESSKLKSHLDSQEEYLKYKKKAYLLKLGTNWYVLLATFLILNIPYLIFGIADFILAFTVPKIVPIFVAVTVVAYTALIAIATLILIILSCARKTKAPFQIYTLSSLSVVLGVIFGVCVCAAPLRDFIHQQTLVLCLSIFTADLALFALMLDVVIVVGVPIIQTFIYRPKKQKEDKTSNTKELYFVLQNPALVKLFEAYCIQE